MSKTNPPDFETSSLHALTHARIHTHWNILATIVKSNAVTCEWRVTRSESYDHCALCRGGEREWFSGSLCRYRNTFHAFEIIAPRTHRQSARSVNGDRAIMSIALGVRLSARGIHEIVREQKSVRSPVLSAFSALDDRRLDVVLI